MDELEDEFSEEETTMDQVQDYANMIAVLFGGEFYGIGG